MPTKRRATEKYGALETIKRTLDSLRAPGCGVRYEKRMGNPYEGPGKADITGALECALTRTAVHHGAPSGTVLVEERVVFAWRFEIEAKREGEAPRKAQEVRLRQWAKIGALCGVATTRADVLAILEPALRLRPDYAAIMGAPDESKPDRAIGAP